MSLNLLTENIISNLSNPKVFRFKTNAQKFKINFSIKDKTYGNYPHVGISTREGIMILYRKSENKQWYNVEAYTERFDSAVYMHHLVKPGEEYEIMIYGPILSNLETLEIENPEETTISLIENSFDEKYLVSGGLVSYGMGCTTPASTFHSILSRKLNVAIDHITFNDKNYLNKIDDYIMNNSLEKYNIGILEVDYVNQDDELVKQYLSGIISELSSCCKHLICWVCLPKYKQHKIEKIQKIIDEIPSENVIFKDFSFIYENEYSDICTYSGNFINDSGNIMIFKKINELIRSL